MRQTTQRQSRGWVRRPQVNNLWNSQQNWKTWEYLLEFERTWPFNTLSKERKFLNFSRIEFFFVIKFVVICYNFLLKWTKYFIQCRRVRPSQREVIDRGCNLWVTDRDTEYSSETQDKICPFCLDLECSV